ncbi:MAG: HU family DNA-binding protein [Neisseriales bacterium]|nr:MAG: HU family DNA-binding protein [Neisseriales bacterium]
MIKSALMVAISERLAKNSKAFLSVSDVRQATTLILDSMIQAIRKEQRIEIRGFGAFFLRYRQARTSRNPKTGQSVQTPAKYRLHFKPGKDLKERINRA